MRAAAACLIACLTMLLACKSTGFRDRTLPIDARVDDLMARMTLAEKVAQICCIWPMAGEKKKFSSS